MYYITVKQSPRYHQMTLEELLFETDSSTTMITPNYSNTRTYEVEKVSEVFLKQVDIQTLISKLREFNSATECLHQQPRESLYHTFYIPKKSGGLRRIDAPLPELMDSLRILKTLFEKDFYALYHTSSFAYVKNRCTLDALKRHQSNQSKWFGKFDLSNFFGSTTLDFVMQMFSIVFPFSEVAKDPYGRKELYHALELAFLDGKLPQGTPVSPLITNVMMIPIDYALSNGLNEFNRQSFVYTRYADDFLVSSKYTFRFKEIEHFIEEVLNQYNAPFKLNHQKTRYGSSAGSNWNLGLMLNKDNIITVGYQKKKQFQTMLYAYAADKKRGIDWDLSDVQVMEGLRNYYRSVEGETIDRIVEHVGQKQGVNIISLIKADLKA